MTIASTSIQELKKVPKDGEPDTDAVAIELLINLAEEAWQLYPGRDEITPRREHVRAVLKEDPTWILLGRAQPAARLYVVQWLLHQASLRREKKITELKHAIYGPPRPPDHPPTTAGGSESARTPTSTNSAAPTAPPVPPGRDRAQERVAARVRVERRLCRLDTVLVDGKPIGDCTVAEVREWARQRTEESRVAARDARFALALVSNLDGGQVIRHHWPDPNEVDQLYDAASLEAGVRNA